ncbi:MAG: hypothetical protein H7Y12_14415, partial [Sphingobacteriaceae bacterium]|nr:hypothetical protein [Cytophagaceae bacterium]
TGVIVESLDEKRQRSVINTTTRVSVLSDISVYTRISDDHMMPLRGIFSALRSRYGKDLGIDPKTATETELADFFVKVAPEYDRDRVHSSDIQKIITWYNLLSAHLPEAFVKEEKAPVAAAPVPAALAVPVVETSAVEAVPTEVVVEAAPVSEAETSEEAPAKKKRAPRKKAVAEEDA